MSPGRRLLPARFFISSYAPLFAILALRLDSRIVAIICAVLALVGVGTAVSLLRGLGRLQPDSYITTTVVDRGPDVAGYVATYLLPFLTVAQPSSRDLLAYAGFLLVSAVIYVRSSMMAVNPLLYLLGFRVSWITDSHGCEAFLISRSRPAPGADVDAIEVVPGVLFSTRP
jgi:hypothetical protein